MLVQDMLDLLKQRTKVGDQTKLLRELRSAHRWAAKRIYNAANGPDLLSTIGEEYSIITATKTLDLAAIVTGGEFLSVKTLWLKLSTDTSFIPMVSADTDDEVFRSLDSDPVATQQVAQSHPVLYDIINFSQARFAPALPASCSIRVDYYRIPPEPGVADESGEADSEELEEEPEVAVDLPAIFHDGMVWKATAQLFHGIDDDREAMDERRAIDELTEAIYMSKRTKGPIATRPYRMRRRRFI